MKLKYLFIHCTASTPKASIGFTSDTLKHLHTSPVSKGGRGWRQVGYCRLVLLDGRICYFVEDDADGWVDSGEITNGAAGFNSISKHICYVGGVDEKGKSKNTLSTVQESSLIHVIKEILLESPDVQILGHNQVANKSCPSFSVIKWLEKLIKERRIAGLTEGNICRDDVFKHAVRLD